MKKLYKKAVSSGFTLIEVMIVVVVIAILTSIALPSYTSYVLKAKRSAAKATITSIASRQETYRMDNKTYTDDLSKLGYGTIYINDETESATSTAGIYSLSILPADTTLLKNEFSVKATAINAQAKDTRCTSFTIDHLGNKTAEGSDSNCW